MTDILQHAPAADDISIIDDAVTPRRLLFIAGWGRSGSTLFANLLGGSDDVQNLGEFRYLWSRGLHGTKCGCGNAVTDCAYWTSVLERADHPVDLGEADRLDAAIGATAIFRQLGALLLGRSARYRDAHRDDIESLVQILSEAHTGPGQTLLDTSKSIPFLINVCEDERIAIDVLHLTRDPRAVAYSWSRLTDTQDADGVTFPRFGPIRCSIYWSIFNLAPLLVRGVNRYQLAYEDFVADPKLTIRSVCHRYGLDFPADDWEDDTTVNVEPQHTISGNPSRFRLGATTIREDERWKTDMPRLNRAIVTLLTAPARAILAISERRSWSRHR